MSTCIQHAHHHHPSYSHRQVPVFQKNLLRKRCQDTFSHLDCEARRDLQTNTLLKHSNMQLPAYHYTTYPPTYSPNLAKNSLYMWLLVFIISNVLYSWFGKCLSCILETQLFRNSFKTLFYIDFFFFYIDILPQIYPVEILLQHHTGTVEIIILIGRVIRGPASKVSNL